MSGPRGLFSVNAARGREGADVRRELRARDEASKTLKRADSPNYTQTAPKSGWRDVVSNSHRLVGQVAKASASRAVDPVFESRLRLDVFRPIQTSDLKIDTPVVTLPGTWRYRVSTGTDRPGVSILSLGEAESWICRFYLSVAARAIV